MAQPLTTSPKARWGIPLVLPHVLLSVGLLTFATLSERPSPSEGIRVMPEVASVTGTVSARHTRRS